MLLMLFFASFLSFSRTFSSIKRTEPIRKSVEQKIFLEGCESEEQRLGARSDSGEQDLSASNFCELTLGNADFGLHSPLFCSDRSCTGQIRWKFQAHRWLDFPRG